MQIGKDKVKELRARTDAGIMDCKHALKQAGGNLEQAINFLTQKGKIIASRKTDRLTKQGVIESYVHHGNKIGVLVEINCETDFVARNSKFKEFARDIAMQIAASAPLFIKREDVPSGEIDKQKMGKQQIEEYLKMVCLLEQPFIKDSKVSVNDYLSSVIAKLGEHIVIKRFMRFHLGEEKDKGKKE